MRYSIYIILTLVFTACKKEIKFNGEIGERQLVVNCLMEKDSTIAVSLSKSTPAIGEQNNGPDEITSSASLVLKDETTGETFSCLSVNSKNVYEFPTIAKEGHTYSISVNHTDFKTATASTIIPTTVPITDWDTSSYKITNEIYKTLDLTIHDPAQDNYYIVVVTSIDPTSLTEEQQYLTVNEAGGYDMGDGESIFLKDDLFQNSTKKISVKFTRLDHYDGLTMQYIENSYRINLYNVSKEAYLYLLSVTKSKNSEGNPFSEPVRVYSNIENGLGIFGGLTKSEVIIQ